MNIFLVGNGFDLYHGLPTKYENFLHTMEYIIDHKDKDFAQFPVGMIFYLMSIDKKDKFIEQVYKNHKKIYDEINFENNDFDIILSLLDNRWLRYFIDSFNKDLGWIDFEKEIAFVLRNLYCFLESAGVSEENAKVLSDFDYFFEVVDSKSGDFQAENNIKIYDQYVDKSPYNFNKYKPNKEKISDELFEHLQELMYLLKLYLKYFVEKPLSANTDEYWISSAFGKADYLVDFNYTNTFEEIYNIGNDKCFHLHGTVDGKIVLGINPDEKDELMDLNTVFIKFKKYYQRIVNRTDNDYQNFIKSLKEANNKFKTLSNSNTINVIVAGHSLDRTDEDIIKELFDYANRIIILCHNDQVIGQYITNLITIYGKSAFDDLRSSKNLEFISYKDLDSLLKS